MTELGLDEILSKEWLRKREQVDKSKLSDEFVDAVESAHAGDYHSDKIIRAFIQQEATRVVKEMIEEVLEWN